MGEPLLAVRDLRVRFATAEGVREVVRGISYDLHAGETVALVGESGCGKSSAALALVRLIPEPPGRVDGEVRFGGRNLLELGEKGLASVRGRHISFVFQEPMSALNPVLTVGRQLTEGMRHHLGLSRREARRRALDLLTQVGIPQPEKQLKAYPHQLSGGQRQRVMIATALACRPQVLLADEATTALDVTIQAEIVELIARLQRQLAMAVLWITHDLGVVAGVADRVLVMYAGEIVEEGPVEAVYRRPRHPYTAALLAALPRAGEARGALRAIEGQPPDPLHLPPGCAFYPRCPERRDPRCAAERPPLRRVGEGHRVACFYDLEGSGG